MPTLQDVAKRAGVSTATVSKVLSNTPYFTEETRDKVMVAVEALGYIPNLAARALSSAEPVGAHGGLDRAGALARLGRTGLRRVLTTYGP